MPTQTAAPPWQRTTSPVQPVASSNPARDHDWCDVLRRLTLPRGRDGVFGETRAVVSPQGIEFSLIAGPPQTLSGSGDARPSSLWLVLLIDGHLLFDPQADASGAIELLPGDLLYGATGRACTLVLPRDFRLLHVKLPGTLIHPRLIDMASLGVGVLSGARGVHRVFADMLRSIAQGIGELDADQLRPIETALAEFMVASVREACAARQRGGVRANLLRQVCDALELRLGDSELSLQGFAAEQRASPRYIQKLFGDAGSSFSGYLRQRRLERCRADLASRSHAALSISEICFRWGFNDAAHFSRSFRLQFGTTPRSFRRSASTPAREVASA